MSAVRVFVGLPLPAAYQDGLAEVARFWGRRLGSKLSWTRPGNWHLTLRFLGEVEEVRLAQLVAALGRVKFAAFALQGRGGGFFPPRPAGARAGRWKPRVLWVGLAQGQAEASSLAAGIEKALLPLHFPAEERPFSAHLTLARIKWSEPDPWDEVLSDLAGRPWPEHRAAHFTLWKSALGPGGPQYSPLAEFSAAG